MESPSGTNPGSPGGNPPPRYNSIDHSNFGRISPELRAIILEMVCEDQVVLQVVLENSGVRIAGQAPGIPGIMHATRETREVALRFFEPMSEQDLNPITPAQVAVAPALPTAGGFVIWATRNNNARTARASRARFSATTLEDLNLPQDKNFEFIEVPTSIGSDGLPEGGHLVGDAVYGLTPGICSENVLFRFHAPHPWSGNYQLMNGPQSSYPATANVLHPADRITLADGAFPIRAINNNERGKARFILHPVVAEEIAKVGSPRNRNFFVNKAALVLKLQFGEASQHMYPTFSLAPTRSNVVPKRMLGSSEVHNIIDSLRANRAPDRFFPSLAVPELFGQIQHLVLNLMLPPFAGAPSNVHNASTAFSVWAEDTADNLVESRWLTSTLGRFPALKTLRFYVMGDHDIPSDKIVTVRNLFHDLPPRDTRDSRDTVYNIPIRESDGVTFNKAKLRILERELSRAITEKAERDEIRNVPCVKLCSWIILDDKDDPDVYRSIIRY
ncbi:uncharacterized protein L3040_009165 [Drepanopeziza brunnea f. sp. 'multigermtubi']|uniref:uncharacterized protein n=1 Tax=Drepanopeziza brunnea f. sp. 'multigermtubi' TaxID=698441 RepID=UPI00239D4298|nr:hypothetical protein L3040_009165 [Drepanopeziza brunnea f. sp. 'multigermtubi']